MHLILLWRLLVIFLQRLPLGLLLLPAEQIQLFTGFLLYVRLFLALGLEDTVKVVGLVIVKLNV